MSQELLQEAKEWHWELCNTLVSIDLCKEMKNHTRKYRDILSGLIEQVERADMLAHENMEIRKGYQERSKRVQELEREFELCDSTLHMIDMTINNPSTSDDDKWEKINKTIKKYYADDCIHCNGKGFNGLDYCPNCIRGEVIKENLELEQQNKELREALEFYANSKNYEEVDQYMRLINVDSGHRARKALGNTKTK